MGQRLPHRSLSALLCLLYGLLCTPLWTQVPVARIDSLIGQLPPGSEVGLSFYDLTAKQPLYDYRATKLSRPASTMKLLTAITALSLPGADEPFVTEVWHDGTLRRDTLHGNLYVVGGFDPEFDDEAMHTLVAQVAALGFSVVNGQVYGDVSMKDSLYWGNGWAWDDTPAAYQPYLSPLMFCKGTVEVSAHPATQRGDTATLAIHPASTYYIMENRTQTRTPAAGNFLLTRNWLTNGNRLVAAGNVAAPRKERVNVYDSAAFFLHTFTERLRAKGIGLPAGYAYAKLPATGCTRIARHETPMQQVLDVLMKESDNLNAEALLCRIGAQTTGKKRIAATDGLAEVSTLIRRLGHDPKEYRVADGCGLSNYNYLSPALLVDLLRHAYGQTDIFARLYKSLPTAGREGTLKNRMRDTAAAGNVHAKTGSFTGINALAGYLKMKNGHDVAFAIINQNVFPAARARAFQDELCRLLTEE